jgi:hypothetical protein
MPDENKTVDIDTSGPDVDVELETSTPETDVSIPEKKKQYEKLVPRRKRLATRSKRQKVKKVKIRKTN